MKKVVVAILNWNGEKLLERFLPSLMRYTPSYAEVCVIDNASTDGSVAFLATHYPTVKVVQLDQNYGFAGGYNHGLQQIEAEYVLLLNSDVEVSEGWIEPLVAYADARPEVAACQPKLRAYFQPEQFEYAGAAGGYIDRYGYPFCRGRIFDCVETDKGQYDDVQPIFWATGAALFVRLAVFRAVGGFDESFFAHMEEIDLCWRILLAHHQIVVVPQSVVYHQGGATLTAGSPRQTYLKFRNNLLMLYKNLPRSYSRRLLLLRSLLDWVAMVKFLLEGDAKHTQAVWQAHRDFRKMRKAYTTFPSENLLRSFPEAHRNITVDYFLKKRRHFRSL